MLTWTCATGELPKGLELERCRGHGFVDLEGSHGGEGNATSCAACTYVAMTVCLRSWPAGYHLHADSNTLIFSKCSVVYGQM